MFVGYIALLISMFFSTMSSSLRSLGAKLSPRIFCSGWLGSPSTRTTLFPFLARAAPTFAVMRDFPTPPFDTTKVIDFIGSQHLCYERGEPKMWRY